MIVEKIQINHPQIIPAVGQVKTPIDLPAISLSNIGSEPKPVTPAEVANILALVLELEPSLVGEVDAIFTGATATDAQVTQAIADLDVANNALLAAINGATTKAA